MRYLKRVRDTVRPSAAKQARVRIEMGRRDQEIGLTPYPVADMSTNI